MDNEQTQEQKNESFREYLRNAGHLDALQAWMRKQVGVHYDSWQALAFCPEALPQLLENVQDVYIKLLTPEHQRQPLHIILPECGCAFLEWHVIMLICKLSPMHRHRVTLMDVQIGNQLSKHKCTWQYLATELRVDLDTTTSYCELAKCVTQNMQTSPLQFTVVIYINGALKFHEGICPEPDACRKAACTFWEWCQEHAINEIPINYVGNCTMLPGGSETWEQLATNFGLA